jgi:hypothetical protein
VGRGRAVSATAPERARDPGRGGSAGARRLEGTRTSRVAVGLSFVSLVVSLVVSPAVSLAASSVGGVLGHPAYGIDLRGVPDVDDPWFWVALLTGTLAVVCAVHPRRPRWYAALPAVAALAVADDPGLVALAFVPPVLLVARALSAEQRVGWLATAVFVSLGPVPGLLLDPASGPDAWRGSEARWAPAVGAWLVLGVAGVAMTVIRRRDDPDDRGPTARISTADGAHRAASREQGVRVRLSRVQWRTVNVVGALAVAACVTVDRPASLVLVLVLVLLWLVGRPPSWWPWVAAVLLVAAWLWVGWLRSDGSASGPGALLRRPHGDPLGAAIGAVGPATAAAVLSVALVGAVLVTSGRRRVRVLVLVACAPLGAALLGFLVGVVLDRSGRVLGPFWTALLRLAVLLALAAASAAS